MGMKDWIQSCVPFFLRRKRKTIDVERKVRKKWTKKGESDKHDDFKSEAGGVAFNVQLPDHSVRPQTAAGTPRPASNARLIKIQDPDGETRYKADVYRRRDALLDKKSSEIRETNMKKRESCLQRKAKLDEDFRCQSRARLESKTARREKNIAKLEVAAKGSRGRIRLYSAVRRANTMASTPTGKSSEPAVKDTGSNIAVANTGNDADDDGDMLAYLP